MLRGIEVNDDTLGTEMMIRKGPGQDYLAEEHTLRYMREEFFVPQLANRNTRDAMPADSDALSRARDYVRKLRSRKPESRLDLPVRDRLLREYPQITKAESA